ncbi:glycosyltransferase family 4 protein [Acinetobacter zhairhuonensis]|uniref:glycosyltransferase family 4 protein n=1 Tax=Acinetobacter sp. A7.4 TaxID=2919921 RepID=UPI001F502EE9|nr:glycosyltransferase family 4 protein [Acinetobacter sp. A7.4]MCJ8161411.1 glycosyltransferase family 4 protein [Acinetobacter sp. A7.4]
MKKNIVIVTRNLPPLVGGMERLNWHIADELSQNNQVTIISHFAAKPLAPTNTTFYSVQLNPLPFFLVLSFLRTLWCCLTQPVDILFAGSGLTAPIVVILAKIFRKKSIIYIHGLDIGTNSTLYKICWVPLICQATQIIANSNPTYQLCIQKKISKDKLSIIHPGVSYPAKPINLKLIDEIKEKYHLKDKKILISVGRLTQRKGLNEFIDLSFSKIIQQIPNTVLVIIGDTPNQSLNKNLQTKELILSTAKRHQIEKNIIFTGNIINDNVLSSFYYLADLHVFPVKDMPEDPEGFGMVAIEAAAHGTPTIAFATGGIIDAVKTQISGRLIGNGNYQHFTQEVIAFINQPLEQEKIKEFASKFSWNKFGEKIRKNF